VARASPGNVAFLPRASWRRRIGHVTLHAGAGLFRDASSVDPLLTAFTHEQAVSSGASASPIYVPVRTVLARGFEPPRSLMARAAVAWHLTRVSAFVDHSWTRAWRLPVVARRADASGVVDDLQSRNHATNSTTTFRVLVHGRRTQLVLNAMHQRARDDGTPGGFEHGAWAPSTGVSPFSLTAASSTALAGNLRVAATAAARSGAPLDIFAGTGPDAVGLFLDRGDRTRNSGRGPAYASIDISLQGAVRFLELTLVAGNVLDTRNATAFGAIMRSPTFSLPLGFMPGRTISLSGRLSK